MFFHHPESEKSLRRMAGTALHGSPMEPSDFSAWPFLKSVLKFAFWETLMAAAFCQLVGLSTPQLREPAWQDLMLAGAVMLTSRLMSLRLFWLLQSSPTTTVLWHLPVAGRDICRWARRTSLVGSVKVLPRMTVVAWAWLGFPPLEMGWMEVLWHGCVLWFVMLACVRLCSLSQGVGRLLGKIWNLALVGWIGLLLYVLVWERYLANGQPLPPWLTALCARASWMLPAQWAMHASENHLALAMALVCVALGALLWWRLPGALAVAYDRLPNAATPEPAEEAGEVEEEMPAQQPPEALQPGQALLTIQQAEADEAPLVKEGWIEKLLLMLLNQRDRMLSTMLIGQRAGWTDRWWKAARICSLLLAAAYALLEFSTGLITSETLEFWIHILPILVVVGLTFPLSNSIPLATLSCSLGQHRMPLFAALPITMRDLLRVSLRITMARMLACLALALPVIAAQCMLLDHAKAMPVILGMAAILSISWILGRPAFIYYRLQETSRPGNRHRFGHVSVYLLIVPLALGTLLSIVFSVTIFQASLAWLAVSFATTACCARAIYAVFDWRVRTQKVDWTSDSAAQP